MLLGHQHNSLLSIIFRSLTLTSSQMIIAEILADFNSLQPNKMDHCFPLASLVSHLRAFLYEHILDSQFQFYSSVVVSGEHHGTGEYK